MRCILRRPSSRSHAFVARVQGLEDRRLLASLSITQVSQGPYDFVTSSQNPGADGIEDVQIVLNNLILGNEISSAVVVGTLTNGGTPLQWVSGSNPNGYLNAEVVRVTTTVSFRQACKFCIFP